MERTIVNNTLNYPWNTISLLRRVNPDGSFGVGSGALVSPHMVLTCAHIMYDREAEDWKSGVYEIHPGAYKEDGDRIYPYGTRQALLLRTNTKYADPGYSSSGDVDYGCLHFVCPFEEITTFMPIVFDSTPTLLNVSGYPLFADPDTTYDQWRGADDVITIYDRQIKHAIGSDGGGSGSPNWRYNADIDYRRIVAVNYSTDANCDGSSSRMVWQNQDLVESWMEWSPSFGQKVAAGCPELVAQPFSFITDFYGANDNLLLPNDVLNLIDPILPPPAEPTRTVMQYIENTFYVWHEYVVPEGRFLEMVKPHAQFLSSFEARALLTASAQWVDEVPPMGEPEIDNAVDLVAIDGEFFVESTPGSGDVTIDVGAPAFRLCPADINQDNIVDAADLAILLGQWGSTGSNPADANRDFVVDAADLSVLLAEWGDC